MELSDVWAFVRRYRYAVAATTRGPAHPQAAVVGIAMTTTGELIFDTLADSRKVWNLRRHPTIAFVIGSLEPHATTTVQYEGTATFPTGAELVETQEEYCRVFPDGRSRLALPAILHVRVRPRWIRYSDFATDPPDIHEFTVTAGASGPVDGGP